MTLAADSIPVVDSHAHVWPHGLIHPAQRVPVPLNATPADLLQAMDVSGVEVAVISPAIIYPSDEYTMKAAAAAAGRFLVVVAVDPRDRASVASIEELVAGCAVGVRLRLGDLDATAVDDGLLGELVDRAVAADLVVQWTLPLSASALLERAAARAPGGRFLIDHLGMPGEARDLFGLDRMRALAAIPNLNVKLSGMHALSTTGYPYRNVWKWAEHVVGLFGPERTVWASDWPLSGESASYARQLDLTEYLPFLDDRARDFILRRTPSRVWRTARIRRTPTPLPGVRTVSCGGDQ